MRAVPAVTFALAFLVAGCVNAPVATQSALDDLSQIVYDTVLAEPLPVAMDDGAVLDMWVFRPDTAATSEKVPVIINFSPYWSNAAPPTATGGDGFSQYLVDHYVPRGYAVALVSVRGTGLSDGCFTIGGPREIDDADAVVTSLGEMEWSNGNVSAVAKSYDGAVAMGVLTRGNPHLRTIVPVSGVSSWYGYNHYLGVPYGWDKVTFNSWYTQMVSLGQSIDTFGALADDPTSAVRPDASTYQKIPTRFCAESADVQVNQYLSVATGDYTPYWQVRNYSAQLPDTLDASVFLVHGLADWNVKPDHMGEYAQALRARNVTVKMMLGQWGHDYPHRGDWNDTLLRWFDSELKGKANGIRDEPLVQVQDNEGVWREEPEWPPARATPITFYPTTGGKLQNAAGEGSAMYADGEGPTRAHTVFVADTSSAPAQAPAPLAVLYESGPLPQALRLVGSPEVVLDVASTGPRATVSVALLLDGVVIDQGFLDLAHRDGLESAKPMQPGQTYRVRVPMYPQDVVLPAGSVIGLYVAHAAPGGAMVDPTPVSTGAVVTLTHGEGTALVLPVIDAMDVQIEDPQPEDIGCTTCD